MGLHYRNLDNQTRKFMLEEIDMDTKDGKLYFSSYLSDAGHADWLNLLRTAAQNGTDSSFGNQLRQAGRINKTAERGKPRGGFTIVNVPVTVHETLSEGEFNRFYIRGVCRRAIEEKTARVEVYRAKQGANPRPESEAKESAEELSKRTSQRYI